MILVLLAGFIGALLMFCGDMILYYDNADFKHDGTLEPLINIMKKLPKKRLMIGGWIGPIAAFFYCIGFYHIVLITNNSSYKLAFIAFLLCCVGIITGGAYHSHCAYLGLLGKDEQREDLNIVMDYFQKMPLIFYIGEGLGLIVLTILVLIGKTIFPRYLFLLTPAILYLLRPLTKKLPKGLHMIICGGFSNIVFVVYYLIAIILYMAI